MAGMPIRRARRLAMMRRNPHKFIGLNIANADADRNAWPLHVHAYGCSDVEKMRSKAQVSDSGPVDTIEEAIEWLLDPEMREMGFGEESLKIYPCTKTGPASAKPVPSGRCPGSGGPFARPITRNGMTSMYAPCPVCGHSYGTGRGVLPTHAKPKAPEQRICKRCGMVVAGDREKRKAEAIPCPGSPHEKDWMKSHLWKKP